MKFTKVSTLTLVAALLCACGASSLQRHASAARVLTASLDSAHAVVEREHRLVMVRAAVSAQVNGTDAKAAADAAEAAFLASRPVIAFNLLRVANLAYVDSLIVWASLDDHDARPAAVLTALRDYLAAYAVLREAMGKERLPAVPGVVGALIGGAK